MTSKTQLPPVPPALADVAMVDAPTCAAACGMSISSWHGLVRSGEAPSPVIRRPRFTRWRLEDVRAFLTHRIDLKEDANVRARAKKASNAARAKRPVVAKVKAP